MKSMQTAWIVILCLFVFIIGLLSGYAMGYKDGAKAVVVYAESMIDKITVENLKLQLNSTKLDTLIDQLQNITDEVNNRLNNITLTS